MIFWGFMKIFSSAFYDENGAIDQFAFLKPYENKQNFVLLSKQDTEKVLRLLYRL